MDQKYDVIVLGTGLKECILSGLMSSVSEKKVLHMDRNDYYGGESASLNLEQLYEKFEPDAKVPDNMGRSRAYCVDLCPKFIMACGNLVKLLLDTKVTRYLDFRSVMGSYVYHKTKVHKVPSTAKEALATSLMGFMQKRRFRNFVNFVNDYDEKKPKTHKGMDLHKVPMSDVYKYFSLDNNTQMFTGHALALEMDDAYKTRPAKPTVAKIRNSLYSVLRFGNSPYIYPMWGLGGLPESFSRLCAIHGGVFMLNKKIDEIVYAEDGKTVVGVRSGKEVAECKQLIADPSYFLGTDRIKKTGQVARCICILDHPIPNTSNADSCQIIIPAPEQKNRNSDIYISVVSHHHNIAPGPKGEMKGKYIAVISTRVEGEMCDTTNAAAMRQASIRELGAAVGLLGKCVKQFFWVTDFYEATEDFSKDGIFISRSYDSTTHFESATKEVLAMYEAITGEKADLTTDPTKIQNDPDMQ